MDRIKIGKHEIVRSWYNRRCAGFGHKAVLYCDGVQLDVARCQYVNRTWERHRYDTVTQILLEKTKHLTKRQKTLFKKKMGF